jgi:outer membrane protein OmpA-like peptidoglycan-associated protein
MMILSRTWGLAIVAAVATLFVSGAASAATHNASVNNVHPATDGGKYITIQQSQTMPQWSYNVGGVFDYGFRPLEYADQFGNRRRGIVDHLFMTNVQGAIAWTDWWLMGVNMPVAIYEAFYNPNMAASAVTKQNLYGKLGDLSVEMKFRFLNIDRYHVGLSLVPYMFFPTGKSTTFLGNGMWSPGGKLVFDADIKNRVFLSFNAGYRNYAKTRYDVNNTNAVIDDTITLGGGINVRINDDWAVLGEVFSESVISGFFKNQLQNPAEFNVGGRWTPSSVKGLGVTLAAGRGITTGVGSPDIRVLAGVNYRHIKSAAPPPPVEVEAAVEEKIVITQKIHFEFNRAAIRPISYPILDDVTSLLQRNPQIRKIRVEGHTDGIGGDAYNQKLSEARANAVRNYLVQKGIEPDRLEAVGYGKTRPIADNATVIGRARNRRTEFTVISAQ